MPDSIKAVGQRGVEIFNREFAAGKTGIDEETRAFWAPEPVIVPFRAALEGTQYSGPTALDDFAADTRESWESVRVDADDIRELDPQRVLVVGRLVGRGRETGAETSTPMANVFVVRNGRVVESRFYASERDALEAANT